MKYPISAKEKAAIYFLLKRLSGHLRLSQAMKKRMREIRMKFTPGDAPVDLKKNDRDAILKILYSVFSVAIAHPERIDKELCFKIGNVIKTLEDKKPCSSTSNMQTCGTEIHQDQ